MISTESTPGHVAGQPFRILTLDGGGAKGFYTLGILHEIEGMVKKPLSEHFHLIFGTSTGAIIAAMLARGDSVEKITKLYREHVPAIMRPWLRSRKTAALKKLATLVFEQDDFSTFKTKIGIVTTNWRLEAPKVFKADVAQAHGGAGTFKGGFGCTIADAVVASCAAYPFFQLQTVKTPTDETFLLGDGGFCANNPAIYALTDALGPLKVRREDIRLVTLGVGSYPERRCPLYPHWRWFRLLPTVTLLQKTLDVNTKSIEVLRKILFKDIQTVRISTEYSQPHMATDLFEHDISKLNLLYEQGRDSFRNNEDALKQLIL